MSRKEAKQRGLLPPEFEMDEAQANKIEQPKPEEVFYSHVRLFRGPEPVRQLLFAKEALGRRWTFDFAWPEYMLAVEIEGMAVQLRCRKCFGTELIVRGRHGSVGGFKEDAIKYNSALSLGWGVMRFAASDVNSKEPINTTLRELVRRGWKP
jgi:very-short-patch-repair endonuclease